jgi:glycosyltransferase involved in cell wall biosynthesis
MLMSKPKRVVVIHPELVPIGGGELVAVGVLLALSRRHETVLYTQEPVDFRRHDAALGTALAGRPVQQAHPGAAVRAVCRRLPARAFRLKMALFLRACRAFLSRERCDLVVSTGGEVDLGRNCLQYVHFPIGDSRQDARGSPFWFPYHWLCEAVSPWRRGHIATNRTLANSHYTARAITEIYRAPSVVLYPPLPEVPPVERPWEQRSSRALCLGRLDVGGKELPKVIEIVRTVREAGGELSLTIAGHALRAADTAEIRGWQRQFSWLDVVVDPDRAQLQKIMQDCRYGLHGLVGEHFGIAVAEFVRAGLVPFAPAIGGAVEIVGEEPGVLYESVPDAVAKITHLLKDEDAVRAVRQRLAARGALFSMERFQREFLESVAAEL